MTDLIASPLTLILDYVDRGEQIKSAIFFSYTFDAGYFERVALGPLESTGARILVVADGNQVTLDPYAARRIGRRYAQVSVNHPFAFHPKVVVLDGEESLSIAVGSANLTMSGWHHSEELWAAAISAHEDNPLASPVARWGADLVSSGLLGTRTGELLKKMLQPLVDGPQSQDLALLSNATTSIIEQIPAATVDELHLYAPFHDSGATALRAIVERLKPTERLVLGYQPGLTHLNTDAVSSFVKELQCDVEVRRLLTERYRHGKLIEWRVGAEWWTVTGSPNLSSVALLEPASRGNHEVAVLCSVDEPLMPSGDEVSTVDVIGIDVVPVGSAARLAPQIQILEATIDGDIVRVQLSSRAGGLMAIEASPSGLPPESWQQWGQVQVGESEVDVPLLGAGSWLRLVGSEVGPSRSTPVLGPRAFDRNSGSNRSAPNTPELRDLFSDPAAKLRFFELLEAFRDGNDQIARPASVASGASGASAPHHSVGWEEYLDRVSERLGDSLLRFALGIPIAGASATAAGPVQDWDEELDDDQAGLEDDDPDSGDDLANGATLTLPDTRSWTESYRRRVLRDFEALPDAPGAIEPTQRMLALRMTIQFVAGGAWPRGDRSWVSIVLRHLDKMAENLAESIELRRRQGSLAALALSLVRTATPRFPPSVESAKVDRSAGLLVETLNDLDQETLVCFCEDLETVFGQAANPDSVLELAMTTSAEDDLDVAIQTLANFGDGIDAERRGDVLVLPKSVADPRLPGLLALKQLADREQVVVEVGEGLEAGVLIWQSPQLTILRKMDNGNWRANVHRLPRGFHPASYSTVEDLPSSNLLIPNMTGWLALVDQLQEAGVDIES